MNNTPNLKKDLDEIQSTMDYSYIGAELKGQPLTEAQKRAKETIKTQIELIDTPEHNARVAEILK